MPNVTRSQWEAFTNIDVMLSRISEIEMATEDELAPLFGVLNSSDATEFHDGVGGYKDVPEYNGKVEYVKNEKLFQTEYRHVHYADGEGIDMVLVNDAKYDLIARKFRMFTGSYARTNKRHRASIFNDAFNTTAGGVTGARATVGGDSVALCSTSHDYSPTDGTHQSNTGTLALTHDNVVTTDELMRAFKDPAGNEFPVVPNAIVVPTAQLEAANVISLSVQKSGGALNDANTRQGLQVLWSPMLTDTNAWFMVDTVLAPQYLTWYWRERANFVTDPTSVFDMQLRYRGSMRYSFGFDDYRWVFGQNPS